MTLTAIHATGEIERVAHSEDFLTLMEAADEYEGTGGIYSEPRHHNLDLMDQDGFWMAHSPYTGISYIISSYRGAP